MSEPTGRRYPPGRWAGGLIFALGLAMMAVVFGLAVAAFLRVPEALAESARGTGRLLAAAGAQIGFLFVMAYLSSLFASKGLELLAIGGARGGE